MKNLIFGIVIGVMSMVIALLGYQVYVLNGINTIVEGDHATLMSVVNFLNSQNKTAQSATPAK